MKQQELKNLCYHPVIINVCGVCRIKKEIITVLTKKLSKLIKRKPWPKNAYYTNICKDCLDKECNIKVIKLIHKPKWFEKGERVLKWGLKKKGDK